METNENNTFDRSCINFASYWYNIPDQFLIKNWNMRLYNFMRYEHLITLLNTKQLYLVNILDKWGDEPYELFYFHPHYYLNNYKTPIDVKDYSHRFYGQCWTKRRDSDAMWRIYTGEKKDGVRICTTLGKIIQLLYPIDINQRAIPYIGFQEYKYKKDIKSWILSHSEPYTTDLHDYVRESLFMKRNNFSHEEEFRIVLEEAILSTNNVHSDYSDHKTISFAHMSDFIQEITLSPFTKDNQRKKQFQEIRGLVSSNIKVNKSVLYKDDLSELSIIIKN